MGWLVLNVMVTPPKNRQKYYSMTKNRKQESRRKQESKPKEIFLLFAEGWGKMYSN